MEGKQALQIQAPDFNKDAETLSLCGTTQLRNIAKSLHVKYYSKLKRDELILAIIAKKQELWEEHKQMLFPQLK